MTTDNPEQAEREAAGRENSQPFDARPAGRTCAGCGHQWPHGAVLVYGDEADWAANFCEACDDPCIIDHPISPAAADNQQAEREAAARAVHAAWMAEKQRQGKSHPHMIPWADLPEAIRAFDYATVDAAWPIIYAAGRAELEGALKEAWMQAHAVHGLAFNGPPEKCEAPACQAIRALSTSTEATS